MYFASVVRGRCPGLVCVCPFGANRKSRTINKRKRWRSIASGGPSARGEREYVGSHDRANSRHIPIFSDTPPYLVNVMIIEPCVRSPNFPTIDAVSRGTVYSWATPASRPAMNEQFSPARQSNPQPLDLRDHRSSQSTLPRHSGLPCLPFCLLPSAFRLLPSAFCLLPSAFCLLPSILCVLPSILCPLPSALCLLPSAFHPLRSAFHPLPSAFCLLPSAFHFLPSALCPLPSAFFCVPSIIRIPQDFPGFSSSFLRFRNVCEPSSYVDDFEFSRTEAEFFGCVIDRANRPSALARNRCSARRDDPSFAEFC
jgi:hypothetical protein